MIRHNQSLSLQRIRLKPRLERSRLTGWHHLDSHAGEGCSCHGYGGIQQCFMHTVQTGNDGVLGCGEKAASVTSTKHHATCRLYFVLIGQISACLRYLCQLSWNILRTWNITTEHSALDECL